MKRFAMALTIAALISAACFAGEVKTAGKYELLSDDFTIAGSVLPQSGDYILYQSVGDQAGVSTITAGTYELTGGFLGVVDETPPTIGITSPVAASQVSGDVGFQASAFDANGVQKWTLTFGPEADPTVKTIASGTADFTSTTVASLDSLPYSGTYAAQLYAMDDRGNEATETVSFSIVNIITISGTIPVHKWVLVSTPLNPDPDDPVSMYGLTSVYKVYRWNPENAPTDALSRYEYPAHVSSGYGYWVKSYQTDMSYSYQGTLPDTTTDYVYSLKTGWNQVGAPFYREFPWNQIMVRDGANTYDLSTAAALGLISDTLVAYDHDAKTWTQHDASSVMEIEKGYNVRAYKNVDLLFSPDATPPSAAKIQSLARVIREPFDYRVKISATSDAASDTDNFFGVARLASERFDRFDLEEPYKNLTDKYVSLYFPHDDWDGDLSGDYTNDIRPAMSSGDADAWSFNVETNQPGETVTLSWDSSAVPSSLYDVTLVNAESGDRVNMGDAREYSYRAASAAVSSNRFRIEMKRIGGDKVVTKKYTLNPGWNLVSMPLEPEVTGALFQLGDDLPALNVFQYFDGKFYGAQEADIQAGIGYWVFVTDDTDIDLEGFPSAPVVRVPMKKGWNILGNPYETELKWDDSVLIEYGGAKYSLSAAAEAGILSPELYGFSSDGYIRQEAGSVMEPWKGYMVKFLQEAVIVMGSGG